MRRSWVQMITAAAAALVLGATPLTAADAAPARALAPVVIGDVAAVIPGRYLVVLEDGASRASVDAVAAAATRAGGSITTTYDTAFPGFAAALPAAALAAVRAWPGVDHVTADQVVAAPDVWQAPEERVQDVQKPATWGLDRVDQRDLPLNEKYKYARTGRGVTTYVIDTGINTSHTDFTGRIAAGYDATGGGTTEDCVGHGTHVAGTLGGTKWGVAKQVTIAPVRVFGCGQSTIATIVDGMEWVAENHVAVSNATMSIGGYDVPELDAGAQAIVDSGIVFTVAAGNTGGDACNFSPARVPGAITVGGTSSGDHKGAESSWGPCLDLFAPGWGVTSAWIGGPDAQNTISGTSMAAPHVAGAVALYLQRHPQATQKEIRRHLVKQSTKDKVINPGTGSPNRLLFTNP